MPEIEVRAFIVSLVAVRRMESVYEVLLLRRAKSLSGEWCQVAGKIEDGETAWQAALRELSEETNLIPDALYSADICEQFYEADCDAITIAPVFVAFIDSAAEVSLNHEHSAFQWVSFDEAIALVPFGGQRRVLRWIKEEFIDRCPNRHLLIDAFANV